MIKNSHFKDIAARGRLLTNSHGVVHVSEPNYVAMSEYLHMKQKYEDDSKSSCRLHADP